MAVAAVAVILAGVVLLDAALVGGSITLDAGLVIAARGVLALLAQLGALGWLGADVTLIADEAPAVAARKV